MQAHNMGQNATVEPDKEEAKKDRIRQRREQLEAKMRAKKAGSDDSRLHHKVEVKPLGKGEQQIIASRKKLDRLKTLGSEEVTKFRIETDIAENERRIAEETVKEARLQKKLDEAASSDRRNGAVQMKWKALYSLGIPQDLLKETQAQQEACGKIIASKDKLINEFQQELRAKDEEYVKALKKQTEDIDKLITTMHQQTQSLISAYEEELEEIETAFQQERSELLEANRTEIDALVEQRRTKETTNRETRKDKVEEEQNRLDFIHENYAEHYNILKMKLQKEIQGLEQQLGEMRALYQLNAEKLDYNLRVLTERVKENEKAILQHKRKLARLQDVLSGLITKYTDTDKKFRQENNIVTEQYRRITEQYKDLQLRYQYFEKADMEKYRQVWEMNEAEAMTLVDQCLKADEVVFEQQLGVEWRPPALNFWGDENKSLQRETPQDVAATEEEEEPLSDLAQTMLDMLMEQCSFLVESHVKHVIQGLEQDQSRTLKIESILRALGLENKAQINKLLQYFTDETGSQLIDPHDAVVALTHFVEFRSKSQVQQISRKNQQLQAEAKQKVQRQKEEQEYWERMAKVIPEGNIRTWDALERGLEKYIVLLQDRTRLIDETDVIRHQNDELRALLNQYMASKINEELFAPPQLKLAPMPQ